MPVQANVSSYGATFFSLPFFLFCLLLNIAGDIIFMSDMWQDLLAKILLYQAVGTPCRLVVQRVHTTEGLRFNNTNPSGMAAAAHASQPSFTDVASLVKRSETSTKLNMASNAYLHILKHWHLP